MKLLLKTEASVDIGFGHLKRLEVLAKEFIDRGCEVVIVHFCSQDYVSSLDFPTKHVRNQDEFSKMCLESNLLIIDEPNFPKNFYECLQNITTVVIDELSALRKYSDVHICSTLLGLTHQILENENTKEYIGVSYFIFGRGIKRGIKGDRTLVSFGGSDPNHITEKLLDQCLLDNLDVVIGPGFTNQRTKSLKLKYPNIRFLENVHQLSLLMASYSSIVCSGGITAYESLKSGCIPLMIAQNNEQERTCLNLIELNLGHYFGQWESFDSNLLLKILNQGFKTEDVDSIYRHFKNLNGEDSTTLVVDLIIQHGQSGKIQKSIRSM